MSVIDELIEIFKRFPGIGPRQAERFVYYLLRQNKNYLDQMARLIPELSNKVKDCDSCRKFYISDNSVGSVCKTCADKNRSRDILMVIARDVDLQSVEKSGTYDGLYFVIGGLVPILDQDYEKKIRIRSLKKIVEGRVKDDGLKEIILALNANSEGENTADIIKKELSLIIGDKVKVTVLGRGLSTGTEIEYSDTDTLKNALENRF